jgi:hypothetical protein
VARGKEKTVSMKEFAENHAEEHINSMVDEYFKKINQVPRDEEITAEVLDLPLGNGIIIVRHNLKTIGSITMWDGTIYVANYEAEEYSH